MITGLGPVLRWNTLASRLEPQLNGGGVYVSYVGATLTAVAFDSVLPGLGRWIVTLVVWLFAVSTMISYSYYAEQGVVFLGGERWLTPFKLLYCSLAVGLDARLPEDRRPARQPERPRHRASCCS